MPVIDSSIRRHQLCSDRTSPKRKLEDCCFSGDGSDESDDWASSLRMRRLNPEVSQTLNPFSCSFHVQPTSLDSKGKAIDDFPYIQSPSSSSTTLLSGESSQFSCHDEPQVIHFFVNVSGKTLNFHEDLNDTVLMLHEKLSSITGIRVEDQRLLYQGRQLQLDQTLKACRVEKDSTMFLVGRMRSSTHSLAHSLVDDIVSTAIRVCHSASEPTASTTNLLKQQVEEYISGIPSRDLERVDAFGRVTTLGPYNLRQNYASNLARIAAVADAQLASQLEIPFQRIQIYEAIGYLKVFSESDAPKALVAMYRSKGKGAKDCADECITAFVRLARRFGNGPDKAFFATIVLDFCKLLFPGSSFDDHSLYLNCRSALASVVKGVVVSGVPGKVDYSNYFLTVQEILPFLSEVVARLKRDLESSVATDGKNGPVAREINDLSAFIDPLRNLIEEQVVGRGPLSVPNHKGKGVAGPYWEESELLYVIFTDLFRAIDDSLKNMEVLIMAKGKSENGNLPLGWSQYLVILKELNSIAKVYLGVEDLFWRTMRRRMIPMHALIVKFAKRDEDYNWLLEHKDILNFESRRHLALLLFPVVKEDYEDLHEMLIDRSHLLEESFRYILDAEQSSLQSGLFIEFKNEEATGPGVLREWFVLVCQAILNPEQALFVTCPQDRQRFFPNPASKVDPLHLKYFRFSGRMIALALMHNVQVGIVLDRSFFLQLAGKEICLESIRDTDPYIYSSCKQILEMDAELIDSDALGLTFVRDIDELGSRRVVELCEGGKHMTVNSENRDLYVTLLVRHCFVTSIEEQVSNFALGFADVLSCRAYCKTFFQWLELEDLDAMLRGSGCVIPLEQWKQHTQYNGYKKSDPQISWFWEVVGQMSEDQKRILLFFWTSVKYLPVKGFQGLASPLYIYRSVEPPSCLPSSHTCFFRLCLPRYPSKRVMRDRLGIITNEHVGCSFGSW